jgi:hypothetical protein
MMHSSCWSTVIATNTVPGQQGEGSNVVGRQTEHPDAHETYVQVSRW